MTCENTPPVFPAEASTQLSAALDVIQRHLEPSLLAVHLYGSAVDGGLKPKSDLDLLVTVASRPDDAVRRALLLDLLDVSAPPVTSLTSTSEGNGLRSLEVTVIVYDDVVPWRYPPMREMQFGEWLRDDITSGIIEPARIDVDLTILLVKARQRSVALVGPPADEFFDPIPKSDFFRAMSDVLKLWNAPSDWAGDAAYIMLTLARIWFSAATGKIVPKNVAADWAAERLPADLRPVVLDARQVYLSFVEDPLDAYSDQVIAFVEYVKREAAKLLTPLI